MVTAGRDTVVVGIDHSEAAAAAVRYAADLASRRRSRLRVVHAIESAELIVRATVGWTADLEAIRRGSAERLMGATLDGIATRHPDLDVSSSLDSGPTVPVLLQESEQAGTVVLGSHGAGGFAGLALGSTTLQVASHAHCPVVAVRAEAADAAAARRGVVVGVDGSQLSEAAVEYGLRSASAWGEPLVAVHAWTQPAQLGPGEMLPLVYDPELVEQEERLVLAESMAGWAEKYPDVTVDAKVVRGHPVPSLVQEAKDARLLVVGSRGRGSVASLVLGSVSHGVLHHAHGPVAVVHRSD
jgi:nucleotide-binding universal stress UspA family protein